MTAHRHNFNRYAFGKFEVYRPTEWAHTPGIDEARRRIRRGTYA